MSGSSGFELCVRRLCGGLREFHRASSIDQEAQSLVDRFGTAKEIGDVRINLDHGIAGKFRAFGKAARIVGTGARSRTGAEILTRSVKAIAERLLVVKTRTVAKIAARTIAEVAPFRAVKAVAAIRAIKAIKTRTVAKRLTVTKVAARTITELAAIGAFFTIEAIETTKAAAFPALIAIKRTAQTFVLPGLTIHHVFSFKYQ